MTAQPRLIGRAAPMREAIEQLDRAAASDVPVLLLGESGTGKELAARSLHARSPRSRGPFVAVNLAALPTTLVEDELFGHDAGAFTGATASRAGRIRKADKGTLFLDEVGDISEPVQAKLLRALEEHEVEPLGSESAVAVDVRVVAATHRALPTLTARGGFRTDLLHRLAVVTITLPPLRERLEDLSELASHFAARETDRLPVRRLSAAALERLHAHSWPGNVRELENAILRARVLARGDELEPADFAFLDEQPPGRAAELAAAALRRGLTLPDLERAVLDEALRITKGNETEAARRLGISRRALEYRLGKSR
ncbi:MAG TPA: sigma-54 dependent transcriptional regulator [Planctomycetota bacterium]|nr:sigma-54 dependent transcriptional regulator [Planctomycetota bacterium]